MAASRSRRPKKAARRSSPARTWWIVAAIAAGLVVGGVMIGITQLGDEDGSDGADETTAATGHPCASGSVPVEGATCGHESAPVTIVEYSEFLCPFCARAALNTVPQIENEYVAAGKVRLEFKHFVVHGEEAALAGGAAVCASEQNAFWQYQDLLFANQDALAAPDLELYAEEVGMDTGEFKACLDSERYVDKLLADINEAQERGVNATPTFFVGQTQVVGAKPYSEFKMVIEDELARVGAGD